MASLSKSRVVFAFTSPRTLEKIIPEIALLTENFGGEKWSGNNNLQSSFYNLLQKSEFFQESSTPKADPALSARDRITRAPKALGFVDLDPLIKLTEIGQDLLNGRRIEDIFTKQLMKFQFPSPYHTQSKNVKFCVKPYLELLRLIYELGEVSKTEISMFFTQMIDYEQSEEIKRKIIKFRSDIKSNKANRKKFIEDYFEREVQIIYKSDIDEENYKIRESAEVSLKKFIKTKMSNMKDYADAFIRYLRATQLITFNKKNFRIIISETKKEEVMHILNTIDRNPFQFDNILDFKNYLFSNKNIELLYDNKEFLEKKLKKFTIPYETTKTITELRDLLDVELEKIKTEKIECSKKELKNYEKYTDIIKIFGEIKERIVPDPALYLEWNIWRAFIMLNDSDKIYGNFTIDYDGVPLNTAAGNRPDIEIEYNDFKMIVEVTTSSGNTQFNMEGESVARHYGMVKKDTGKDVYCIFIAPKISEGTLAHFFNLNRFNTKMYGGKTKIIPLDLNNFYKFLEIAKNEKFSDSKILYRFLEEQWQNNQKFEDESIWKSTINKNIENWCIKAKDFSYTQ